MKTSLFRLRSIVLFSAWLLCVAAYAAPTTTLSIAHINDHHSNLDPINDVEVRFNGVATRVELGGFARLVTLFNALPATTLKIHAGDAQTGTLYHTLFKGQADAALMNHICFDAFTLGNHEFDEGDKQLAQFIAYLKQDPRCKTAVLSANVKPQGGTPLKPANKTLFAPYTIKKINGIRVGLIGLTVKGKTVASSRPLESTMFIDEKIAVQSAVYRLQRQGIRHIVLVSHIGYEADKQLAQQLSGIDVIIGGDSHTLLGNYETAGLASQGPYPTQVTDRKGAPVCIGHAWEYSKAFGQLDVTFDRQGVVQTCQGKTVLPIGTSLSQKDAAGKWVKVDSAALLAQLPAPLQVVVPDPSAAATLKTFSDQIATLRQQKIGTSATVLCHVRIPGTNAVNPNTPECLTQVTPYGSSAAQIVAQAFLSASKRAQIALQNAGGVRVGIAPGDITVNTAYTVLPFSNVLVEMDLSGQEIVQTLEDAAANHLDNKGSSGSHPYAAGLRWQLDMSQPRGSRFSQVEVKQANGSWLPLEAVARYTVVTNDFIASGQDGYTTLGQAFKQNRYINTYLYYTQTLIDYLQKNDSLTLPAASDYAHQRVITREGKVLTAAQ